MSEPSSPPKGIVRFVEELDDEEETAHSIWPDETSAQPQRLDERVRAHFDSISTASNSQAAPVEGSSRQSQGQATTPRTNTPGNIRPGREKCGNDDTHAYVKVRLSPEPDDPEIAKHRRALERWAEEEVTNGWPTPPISQYLPSQHAQAACGVISAALNRPINTIPYSGVPPEFVNTRKSSPKEYRSNDDKYPPKCHPTTSQSSRAADTATAAGPVVPNPGVRPEFSNPYGKLPPILNKPSNLSQYKLQKEREAAAVDNTTESSSGSSSSCEERRESNAEEASGSSTDQSERRPLLGGPRSVRFDDPVYFSEDITGSGPNGAGHGAKRVWRRIKDWAKRKCRIRRGAE